MLVRAGTNDLTWHGPGARGRWRTTTWPRCQWGGAIAKCAACLPPTCARGVRQNAWATRQAFNTARRLQWKLPAWAKRAVRGLGIPGRQLPT